MKKILILVLMVGLMTGCAQSLASLKSECDAYGFISGTDAHSNCMMNAKQENQRNRAQAWQNFNTNFQHNNNARIQAYQNMKNSIGNQRNSYTCTSRSNGSTGAFGRVITDCQ